MHRSFSVLLVSSLVACGGGPATTDSGAPDAFVAHDSSVTPDSGPAQIDSGPTPGCGNGIVEVGEICFHDPAPVGAVQAIAYPALAIADVNGDERPDILYTDDTDATGILVALLQEANGTFTATPSDVEVGPSSVATGDFNGDTYPDVLIGSGRSTAGQLLLNDHAGHFSLGATIPVGLIDPAPAHADSGTTLDVIAATGGGAQSFQVALGHGDGMLDAPVSHVTTAPVSMGVVGDLDGDLATDVVIVENQRAVLIFTHDATTAASWIDPALLVLYDTPPVTNRIALADIDEDHDLDILPVGQGAPQWVRNAHPSFSAQPPFAQPLSVGSDLAVLDVDGDGHLDVIYVDDVTLLIYVGHGDGTFAAAPQPLTLPGRGYRIAAGDIDRDGAPDLVVSSVTATAVWLLASNP